MVWGCCARSRQAGLRSQVAPLPTNSPPPGWQQQAAPAGGLHMQNKKSGRGRNAAARPCRDTLVCNRMGSEPGPDDARHRRLLLGSAKSRRRQSQLYLPPLRQRQPSGSDCAAWRGAAAGGDRSAIGSLGQRALLEPSQSFCRLQQVLEPRLAPLFPCAHTSAPRVMRGACMHARESPAPNRA